MSVWLCIPSARPVWQANVTIEKWMNRGYLVALWCDSADGRNRNIMLGTGQPYPGYAAATNALIREVLRADSDCQWCVIGGDDVDPDPIADPDLIAHECEEYFRGTYGVMQPTGDRWGEEDAFARARWPDAPAYIDRVCGSAWLGREFCERSYGGNGPLFPGYTHMFVDEELQEVAQREGILWQRRDLTQKHNNCQRNGGPVPEFLRKVYGPEHWQESQALFNARKAAGFPGSRPLERI